MEGKVKEELSEEFNSVNMEQQEQELTLRLRDLEDCPQRLQRINYDPVISSQQLSTVEDVICDDMNKDTICCRMCPMRFLSEDAFANHVSTEHSEACTTGNSGLWNEEQTYINYYDTVKIEIHENEIREDIYSFEQPNLMSSYPKNDNSTIASLKTTSQLEKKGIMGSAPSAKKTRTEESWNKNYEEKEKVNLPFGTIQKLTEKDFDTKNIELKVKNNSLPQNITQARKKLFSCYLCNYKSNVRKHLINHLSEHSGEQPFVCNICDYKCNQSSDLKIHFRSHTGDKPFACSICDYKCSDISYLTPHIRSHSGVKPYACNICDYKCSYKSDLRLHLKSHTGENPFACKICDYKCSDKTNLTLHVRRSHTGEKPFACNICDYKCSTKGYLKLHISIHTGEKPFSCNVCDYKCNRNSNLKRHIRSHTV